MAASNSLNFSSSQSSAIICVPLKGGAQGMDLWRDNAVVRGVTFEKACVRVVLVRRLVEQSFGRLIETRRYLLRPAARKPQDERFHQCWRSDLDRVRLPVVQDKVTAVIDCDLRATEFIKAAPIGHAFKRERQSRRVRKIRKRATAHEHGPLQGAERVKRQGVIVARAAFPLNAQLICGSCRAQNGWSEQSNPASRRTSVLLAGA